VTRGPAGPRGVETRTGVVDAGLIDQALRLLHTDLLSRGANPEELGAWLWGAHWFPHLVEHPTISALAETLPPDWQTGERCDPQILLHFPHTGPEPEITFHLDREPAWAAGRRYLRVVGVPLSPWRAENGGLLIDDEAGPTAIELEPGDAVMFEPWVSHSGGINRTGQIRYGVYFRWLEPAAR
jgi:hypothetical protein